MSEQGMNGHHGDDLEVEDDSFHHQLLYKMNVLREGSKFCDVHLVVGHHDVPAHRCILASCSPYLFDLFSQEEESGMTRATCKLKEVEYKSFEFLLKYMYTGRITIPSEEVAGVYVTARKLKMEEVARQCVAFLADKLTPSNCLGIRSYAIDGEMKDKVDKYIQENFNEILDSKNFFGLPNLQVEIVGADEGLLNSRHEAQLFDLVLLWAKNHVNQDTKKSRLDHLTEQQNVLYLTRENTLQDCQDVDDGALKEDYVIQDYRKLKRKQNGKASSASTARTPSETNNNQVNSLPFHIFHIVKDTSALDREWKIIAFHRTAENTYMGISMLNGCMWIISLHCRVARGSPPNSVSDCPDSPVHASSESQSERCRSLSVLASMSTPRCGFGLRAVGDRLIACGGYDRGECLKSTECYNLESNSWTILSDMKTTRGRFSTARLGDHIYACGGSNGHHELNTVEVYDVEEDVWSFVASMNRERSSPGCAVLNNQLYCIGGCMGQDSIAECEVYNPDTNTWSMIAPLNTARYQASVRAFRDRLYVIGGTDGWTCLKSVEVYDPSTDSWEFIQSLNSCRRGAGVESYQGKLYVVGGNDGINSLKSTEIYDLDSESWKFGPNLTTPRSNNGSSVLGGRLFAVGGFNGKKFLDTMEYIDRGQEWSYFAPAPTRVGESNGENGGDGPIH